MADSVPYLMLLLIIFWSVLLAWSVKTRFKRSGGEVPFSDDKLVLLLACFFMGLLLTPIWPTQVLCHKYTIEEPLSVFIHVSMVTLWAGVLHLAIRKILFSVDSR